MALSIPELIERHRQLIQTSAQRAIDKAALEMLWRIAPPVVPNRLYGAEINSEGEVV